MHEPALAGNDIDQLKGDQTVIITEIVQGYPIRLSEIPYGDYFVHTAINVYQQVHRATYPRSVI